VVAYVGFTVFDRGGGLSRFYCMVNQYFI